MKSFKDHNPIAIFLYYIVVIVPAMFCVNPVLMFMSLFFAVAFRIVKDGRSSVKKMLPFFAFPVLATIINPIFVHKGMTVLFILNDNPITLEAVLYGLTIGMMVTSTIIWFSSFNSIMTTDKLLYVFGSVSPKIALILSMTLRYVPLYSQQIKKIRQAQLVTGLYKEDNAIDRIRGGMRIMSVMVSWALENGIITADSMTARGYGVGPRSRFSIFSWGRSDKILALVTLGLGTLIVLFMAVGKVAYEYYPQIITPGTSFAAMGTYVAYALLGCVPIYLQLKEEARWRSLQSEI